jgi:hypothetical protein
MTKKEMQELVQKLVQDPDVFKAWKKYGAAGGMGYGCSKSFHSWVAYIVLEYNKRKVDIYT